MCKIESRLERLFFSDLEINQNPHIVDAKTNEFLAYAFIAKAMRQLSHLLTMAYKNFTDICTIDMSDNRQIKQRNIRETRRNK